MLVNRLQGVSTVPVSGGDLSLGVLKDSNFLDYFAGGVVTKTTFRIVLSTNTSLFFWIALLCSKNRLVQQMHELFQTVNSTCVFLLL